MKNDLLARRFVHHHLENPKMWEAYEKLALEAIRTGRKSMGVGALTEILRWDDFDLGDKADGFRLSNSFRAFYARMFAHIYPEHERLFRYNESAANYINYEKLMQGDAKGALNWDDPQMSLPLESK